MKWSFRVARVAGIAINVHVTFFFLLAYVAWMSWQEQPTLSHVGAGVLFTLITFGIIALHELGHALSARWFGIRTKDITMLPFGGLARLERMPDKPWQEMVVAIAGPAVNVVLAAAGVGWLMWKGRTGEILGSDPLHGQLAVRLLWLNVVLTVFNMIPAFPMDGGRVLRAGLAMMVDHGTATKWAVWVGKTFAALFILGGIAWNPGLALVGVFVWLGAGAESRASDFRQSLQGLLVGHALLPRFETLNPRESCGPAAQRAITSFQRDFPVLFEGKPVGMVSAQDLCDGMARLGPEAPVDAIASRQFPVALPTTPLQEFVPMLQASRFRSAAVVNPEGHLIGMITLESIAQMMMVRAAHAETWSRATQGR